MSGPKIDQAELERQRRAELERIRQERLRKIQAATENLNIEISKTKTQIDYIDKHLALLSRNAESAQEMSVTISQLKELKSKCKSDIRRALEINVPTEPDAILACGRKLANETRDIMGSYAQNVQSIEQRIQDYNKQIEIQNTYSAISKGFSAGVEEMGDIEDFDFTTKRNRIVHSQSTVKERAEQILSEIEELVNSESIQESDMVKLLGIANNIYKTAFETGKYFEAAEIDYNVVKPQIVKNIDIFDHLYQEYYAECVVYLDYINKYRTDPIMIAPQEKYRFSTIAELEAEVKSLADSAKTISENNYIREQINEVMALYGYNIAEEIVFGESHKGNHFICANNSGNSAIHLYISDKKQVMMEVVGVGKQANAEKQSLVNASITESSELSGYEREHLLEEQGRFCDLHPQIVKELGKRGVVFGQKERNAPSLEYCRRINYASAGASKVSEDYRLFNERAGTRNDSATKKKKYQEIKAR